MVMAANLRSAIRRASRRVISEDLLTLLRGPRPRPNPAAAPEVDLLAKKVNDAGKKGRVMEFAESLLQEEKKRHESPNQDWVAVPFFTTISFVAVFGAGHRLGREHGTRCVNTGNLNKATNSVMA